jgi:hypothetical protein
MEDQAHPLESSSMLFGHSVIYIKQKQWKENHEWPHASIEKLNPVTN